MPRIFPICLIAFRGGAYGSTCTWRDPASGRHFDLAPLTRPSDHPYLVSVSDNKVTDRIFLFNICGEVDTKCPDSAEEAPAMCLETLGGHCQVTRYGGYGIASIVAHMRCVFFRQKLEFYLGKHLQAGV